VNIKFWHLTLLHYSSVSQNVTWPVESTTTVFLLFARYKERTLQAIFLIIYENFLSVIMVQHSVDSVQQNISHPPQQPPPPPGFL
jgi:hypothetical protein